ncbi:uncharacterized protein TOT_040000703 [Theileria orientalis strain Shintoku]|uniref:Hemolysin III n=1 Tax=Theileria orientalis strain Shintoku TaxID=869250 RepID=J7M4N3_THEOR|nr:uncharacterized protein TOT_040000703 [Theileria orientalis strain Shintoku]BAM42335.1 uncharacterized protein TOT_040000703 [Theileria orientalis strain Shintoku]|eukprot:XP_009692636.1 uncharacterized protein TOT_040000703 [Theileria orientalis strain Shintoku]
MKDHKLNFLYNKRKGVPLLRGRIYIFNFLMIPLYYYSITKYELDNDTRLTFYIHFLCYVFNTLACALYHNGSCNLIDRSTYRRMDYAGVFMANLGSPFPGMMYFLKTDLDLIVLLTHLFVNFLGALAYLNTDLIYSKRFYRYVMLAAPNFISVHFLYNIFAHKRYLALVFYLISSTLFMSGAIIWTTQKPNFFEGVFEFHELCHTFYLIAIFMAFMMNCSIIIWQR